MYFYPVFNAPFCRIFASTHHFSFSKTHKSISAEGGPSIESNYIGEIKFPLKHLAGECLIYKFLKMYK